MLLKVCQDKFKENPVVLSKILLLQLKMHEAIILLKYIHVKMNRKQFISITPYIIDRQPYVIDKQFKIFDYSFILINKIMQEMILKRKKKLLSHAKIYGMLN